VYWAVRPYRDLRIENSLTDEHGDEVGLKKGAHVDVTITAKEPFSPLNSRIETWQSEASISVLCIRAQMPHHFWCGSRRNLEDVRKSLN